MNTNSNSYTIIYASVLVVIVAFLLAFISSVLKPTQEANVALDKKSQILAALNLRDVDDVEREYNRVVQADMLITTDGSVVNPGTEKDKAGFTVNSKDITDKNLPLYICEVEGKKKYVIPMTGRGLWGGLWGYIAVNDDASTVYGAYFSHESETAGLGARIVEPAFQEQFIGKHLFSDTLRQEIALTAVKNGKVLNPDTEVDGITGATLTTVGLADMVKDGLQKYVKFLNANKK